MDIRFTEKALSEFLSMNKSIQLLFKKGIEKIIEHPLRRHLKYGIPYHVVNITKQSRLIYSIKNDTIYIHHCFTQHKDYENWYNSYK
ncbi:MAG: hypothetical protein QG635_618 [Bacteroidota bacterium]|nr:hypothetical protein [Bacteroidota bacterium]